MPYYPKPRGRPPHDKKWNHATGRYDPAPGHIPTSSSGVSKKYVRGQNFRAVIARAPTYVNAAPQSSMTSVGIARVAPPPPRLMTAPPPAISPVIDGFTKEEEEERTRLNMEEARQLEDAMKKAEERNLEEEIARKLEELRRMQPYMSAKEEHQRTRGRVPVYYVDWDYNMHSFTPTSSPQAPSRNVVQSCNRPFVWKKQLETRWISHEEDPEGLEPGETELREVVVMRKSYNIV